MPAIRDTSFAYESTTTDAGLTIPMCAYAEGDLLFAFVVSDTGTPTITATGWTQLFQRVNTCSLTVLWKYAAASEGDVVIGATVNETYSGCLVAVRDVYQGYTGGSPPVVSHTTSTGTRIALPTITTSADNSLVLAVISSAGTSSINFVEEALQDLVKVDGAAESLGVGWFFKKTAGLTTAYNASSMSSQTGAKAVIEVRAPAGGATVIPPYPVSDASIYMGPSPQIAWDSNTAMAATADTNFGTSIAGKTCNDGTVAAAADIGLDKGAFMSMGGLTNAVTANQISGAEVVMAASRRNVGNRNIQTYFRHPTPAHNQRLSPLSSGRGVWFGMRSGVTAGQNWKVWQVHGGDVKLPPGYVMPITINPANTDTIATNGTLSNSDVHGYGFWTGGIGALTQKSCFGPMWAMDTAVLAGGNAAEPIDIPGIIEAMALNKVRFSSLLQGNNQMLCLQAIQFGDGGTNPLYMKVNGAAVEFPSQKNLSKKVVNYNGIDNAVGWTFYPGASDTIDISGTAFASASKYHWIIHASASGSASYDFAGVSLTGAGDVQLRAVATFESMSFVDCPTITQNGAAMVACNFFNSTLFSNAPNNISGASFTSGGTGHAIEISTPGTYTFNGNVFSGYAASNGSTGNEAIYNNSGGAVTLNITGGGSTPSIRNGAGASTTVNANVSITLTGLKNPSEVRVFEQGTTTEIASSGAENVITGSHTFSVGSGVAIDIVILSLGYQNMRILNYSTTADASIPISQVLDRQYGNA